MHQTLLTPDGKPVPPRPTLFDDDARERIILAAVEKLYTKSSCPFSSEDKDGLIESLVEHYETHMDLYDLAKLFDEDGWPVTRDFIDDLEMAESCISAAMKADVLDWATSHKPQPPHPDGTRLIVDDELGTIDGTYEYDPATYRVKMDSEPDNSTSRRIIHFEHAVKAD